MRNKYIISLIAAIGLLTGCIREDRSDCTCDVMLSFIYLGDEQTDIFPDKIDKVNMYIYSSVDNSLVEEHTFDKAALTETQGAHLYLKPGEYRIVCWGNVFDRTVVNPTWGDAKVAEPALFKSETYIGTDPLYFGSIEVTVPETLQKVQGTCYFESSHIDMFIRLKGFKGAIGPTGDEISLCVTQTGCPVYTDFFNIPASDKCNVTASLMDDPDNEDSYIMRYNVLRFMENENLDLVLTDNADGHEIYSLSIPDFIERFDLEVYDRQEALVPIQIVLGPTGIEAVDWNVEEVFPGFD